MASASIYNRELALISIGTDSGDGLLGISLFSSRVGDDDDVNETQSSSHCDANAEDAFLTKEGIEFVRRALL